MTMATETTMSKKNDDASATAIPFGLKATFWEQSTYKTISLQFHPFHKHDMNVAAHLVTTGVGVWAALQLVAAPTCGNIPAAVWLYAALIAATTPIVTGAVLHTAFCYACLQVPVQAVTLSIPFLTTDSLQLALDPWQVCLALMALCFVLQDVSHLVFGEKTYFSTYITAKPWMLVVHSIWLMPLVIDSLLQRCFFLPKLFVSRNRNINCDVASRRAVEELREWINKNVPSTPETTHVWPHNQDATSGPVSALENDAAIMASFRKVFAAHHFDIKPVQGMNEIYVTAVGAKKEINSDAVFYTPHCDGPYWFTPYASLYRVLVGVTPNKMVRTRFNLQHESQNQVLDMYHVCGFDYNRELHWIDHVPGQVNTERRSLVKLHFVVYPKGWTWYGNLVANLNQAYNTWARGNFLRTLRPAGMYEFVLAWWIWLTTWSNYVWEENFGWSNLVYLLVSFAMGPTPFLIMTSFRHYLIYMCTLGFRQPPVAHGFMIRDAKLYKSIALLHLGRRILPLVKLSQDWPGVALATAGFGITMAATAQLGFERTYFGSELGFCKPKWINGFPYNVIPHPMIVGQLFAFSSILYWFQDRLTTETFYLVVAHMTFYMLYMVQEMLTSSY